MMSELVEVLVRASIIGVAGVALMDVWGAFSRHVLHVQGVDYALLGRWIGHLPRRRFFHARIAAAEPIRACLASVRKVGRIYRTTR